MNRQAVLITVAVLLSFGGGGCQTTSEQSASSQREPSGLRSDRPQEQRESEERLHRQNLEERRRLEGSKGLGSAEIPPYSENQPIGGQQQAGAGDFPQPAFPFVKGELVQIEGEYYVVRDAEGKNVRVHVDKRTQMDEKFRIGDTIEVQRTLPGHAVSMRRAEPLAPAGSSASSGVGAGSGELLMKDSQVTLGGAKQVVRGEVLQIDGDRYLIRDGHGNEVRLAVNQNTRMSCSGDMGSLLPVPSASDKPNTSGQLQDLSRTAEQQGSQLGPGTRPAGTDTRMAAQCFKPGELIEAEVSDMGVATFVKQAGRRQPGQALP